MPARARTGDPYTSHLAAASVKEISAAQARLLALYGQFGDLTDTELARHYQLFVDEHTFPPISPSGLRSRRHELVEAGRIYDTGIRARTPSGRACIAWGLTERGLW